MNDNSAPQVMDPLLQRDETVQAFMHNYIQWQKAVGEMDNADRYMSSRIGIWLKRIRVLCHRMSQREMAEALGVDHTTISKIESGQLQPGNDLIVRLHNFIGTWGQE